MFRYLDPPPFELGTKKQKLRGAWQEGDIGVLPPLGVYDPLGLIEHSLIKLLDKNYKGR